MYVSHIIHKSQLHLGSMERLRNLHEMTNSAFFREDALPSARAELLFGMWDGSLRLDTCHFGSWC